MQPTFSHETFFFFLNYRAWTANNRKTSERKIICLCIPPYYYCFLAQKTVNTSLIAIWEPRSKNPNFQGCMLEERALTISRPSPGHPGILWPPSQSFLSCLSPRQLTKWHHHGLEWKALHFKSLHATSKLNVLRWSWNTVTTTLR